MRHSVIRARGRSIADDASCREESVEGSDQQRITDLENKIGTSGSRSIATRPSNTDSTRPSHAAALQQQLRNATSSTSLPRPPTPTAVAPTAAPIALTRESLANEISRHVTEILSLPETATLHNFIAEEGQKNRSGVFGSIDQRLASGGLADAVTGYLLDGEGLHCAQFPEGSGH